MDTEDLVRDALPVNQPYDGLVAEAYDTWLPPAGRYTDRELWRRAIEEGRGPALELGCGNGRLLVGYAANGLDVAGLDSSADMLSICAAHARAAGLDLRLHRADWSALELDECFATIYNPAGSFALVADDDAAIDALARWRRHLRPDGRVLLSMGVPRAADIDRLWEWRIRRSATRPVDGTTFMVHEAFRYDVAAQVQHVINRHEVWDADGVLQRTLVRRLRLRWWTRAQMDAQLSAAGYVNVGTHGDEESFVVVGHAG